MKKVLGYIILFLLLVIAGLFIYRVVAPEADFENFYQLLRLDRTVKIDLYFTRGEMVVPVVRDVPRSRSLDQRIKDAIALLLNGPNDAEKAAGYDSVLPPEAKILNVFTEGNVAFLDFSREIDEGGGTQMMLTRLRQIVYTATQFSGIEKVSFLIEGQPIKYFSGEGLTEVEHPIGRVDLGMEER